MPFLDKVADGRQHRLRAHPMETVFDQNPLFKPLEPEALIIDPEDSVLDESLFESLRQDASVFATSVRFLTRWFIGGPERAHPASLPVELPSSEP